ncbi:MAG: hypothetical protein ACFFDW_05695 [Candidatus Thorarchaeota archaeon]
MDAEKETFVIDGKSEYIITHAKKRKMIEFLFFLFWAALGSIFIVIGSIFSNQSVALRIVSIVAGSIIVLIFFESFFSKLTNKIVLDDKMIKTRSYFFWTTLNLDEITSIEIEKKASEIMKKDATQRITILKINSVNSYILYPIYRFTAKEAENIVEIIKLYYRANIGSELKEVSLTNDSETKTVSGEMSEAMIDSQIPPRVESFEVEDEKEG